MRLVKLVKAQLMDIYVIVIVKVKVCLFFGIWQPVEKGKMWYKAVRQFK